MDDKKKKYVIPEAEIVNFGNNDIITISGTDANNTDWTLDPDGETFSAQEGRIMKKKFLLAVIPALMVLSSCAGAGQKVEVKNDNLFVEDTLAHEEIFGDSEIVFQDYKAPLRAPSGPVAPVYGVQYQESGDNVHVRFIAAIWLANSSIEVEWTRTMYKGHLTGEEASQSGHVFKAEADKACTKAYTSLANGSEEPLTIASINSQYGDGDDYNYFVVYTMLNIPKATYGDYSIRANIKLNDVAASTGIAATVGQTAYATFDLDRTGHFISGKFNGSHNEYAPEYDGEHTKGDNNAVYYGVDLKVGDTFALVYYESGDNVFLLNGTARDGDIGYFFSNDQKTMTTRYAGTFNIYLNNSDMIYSTATTKLTRPIYVDVSERTWWGESSSHKTVLYAFGGTEDATFIVMNRIGTSNMYVTPSAINPSEYSKFIVLDYNGSTPAFDANVVNQSKDSAAIDGKNKEDCIKIWDQDAGDSNKWWISWVVR